MESRDYFTGDQQFFTFELADGVFFQGGVDFQEKDYFVPFLATSLKSSKEFMLSRMVGLPTNGEGGLPYQFLEIIERARARFKLADRKIIRIYIHAGPKIVTKENILELLGGDFDIIQLDGAPDYGSRRRIYKGYFIASIARKVSGGWYGAARIFRDMPDGFYAANPIFQTFGDRFNLSSEMDSLNYIDKIARRWIDEVENRLA